MTPFGGHRLAGLFEPRAGDRAEVLEDLRVISGEGFEARAIEVEEHRLVGSSHGRKSSGASPKERSLQRPHLAQIREDDLVTAFVDLAHFDFALEQDVETARLFSFFDDHGARFDETRNERAQDLQPLCVVEGKEDLPTSP